MQVQERVQSMIYSLEEGAGRALLRLFIAAVVSALVCTGYAVSQFRGLTRGDSMELAQIGRSLAEGRGFTTRCVRPADLWFLARAGKAAPAPGEGIPDLRHAPAYPALVGWALRAVKPPLDGRTAGRLAPADTRVILPVGVLFTALSGLLVLAVGSRLFGTRVGVAAFAAFVLSDATLSATISGGSAPLGMFLTTASVACGLAAVGLRSRQAPVWAWLPFVVLAGLASGLAALTAYALIAVPIAVALVIGSGFVRGRGLVVTLFLVTTLGVLAPWAMRNHQVSGGLLGIVPHASLNGSALFPGDGWDRAVSSPDARPQAVLTALRHKAIGNLKALYGQSLPMLGGIAIAGFFLLALFHRFDEDQAAPLKWGVALALGLTMVLAAFGRPGPDVLLPYLPLAAVLGAALLFRMLDQVTGLAAEMQSLAAWAWVGLAALPMVLTLGGPAPAGAYPPYAPSLIGYVSSLMKPGELMATDIPWAVAWYGGKTALETPTRVEDLVALRERGLPVGAVYLTSVTGDRAYIGDLVQGREASWLPLLNQLVPEAFPWQHAFAVPPGRRDQIFLTDATRWEQPARRP